MKVRAGQREFKPKAILLSQRANILYLERARVLQKDGRVLYLQEAKNDIDQFFNIPHQNTSLLLLGKGTSITDSAARQLADAGVVVGFTGSGATPLTCGIDPVFMAPKASTGRLSTCRPGFACGLMRKHELMPGVKCSVRDVIGCNEPGLPLRIYAHTALLLMRRILSGFGLELKTLNLRTI